MKTLLLITLAMVVALFALTALWQPAKRFAADAPQGARRNRRLHGAIRPGAVRHGLHDRADHLNGPMYGTPPATRVKANKQGGRIRIFEAQYVVPAVPPGIGDKIVWGKLPVRSRVIGHLGQLNFGAGNAASTLNLGDNVSAARHLAATAVNAAGVAVPQAQSANGASFETSDDTANVGNTFVSATDDCTLISTVAGAALLAGQVITLRMPYVCD
jgi:hypothetical protein